MTGRDREEISRTEDCGCKSFRLDNPKWEGEEFWAMEASCPVHVKLFEYMEREWERHAREDHHGVDEDCLPM